ncbi:hypothetical protein WP8W19C03_17770 [Aeromonas veronii]|nr:hypothetical protein WP8W19C03_17770 [Aeromonas veronii]
MYPFLLWLRPPSCSVCLWQYPTFWRLQLGQGLAPTPVEPPLPETLVNSVLSISFNTPDCLIVTIGTVCENQDTSGFIERLHRTLLDEHFRIKGRTTWYESVEQMQTDLDSYLEHYNTERPHQGRMMEGQTPYSMFKKGLKLIPKEVRTKVA